MPLHVPPAPAPALRSVLAALGSPTAVREARTPALRSAPGPLTPELPSRSTCWTGSPRAAGPRAPACAGWRFLISDGDHPVAAADTGSRRTAGPSRTSSRAPTSPRPQRALRQAETARHALPAPAALGARAVHAHAVAARRHRAPTGLGHARTGRPAGAAGARPARHLRPPPAAGQPNCCRSSTLRLAPAPLLGAARLTPVRRRAKKCPATGVAAGPRCVYAAYALLPPYGLARSGHGEPPEKTGQLS